MVHAMSTKITDYSADVPLAAKTQATQSTDSMAETQTMAFLSDAFALRARDKGKMTSPEVSQVVFSNPQEFLQVIKADFARIEKAGAKQITKDDLQLYSQNGSDVKGRAAAAIAVKHYEQLQGIAHGSAAGSPIAEGDIDRDIDYVTGNIAPIISAERKPATKIAEDGVSLAVLCLSTARRTESIPYLPVALTVVAGGALIVDGFMVRNLIKQKGWTQKVAEENKNMVKSWL